MGSSVSTQETNVTANAMYIKFNIRVKHVRLESGSQGILGGKVDEPPKTSLAAARGVNNWQRHAENKRAGAIGNYVDSDEVVRGLAAKPDI